MQHYSATVHALRSAGSSGFWTTSRMLHLSASGTFLLLVVSIGFPIIFLLDFITRRQSALQAQSRPPDGILGWLNSVVASNSNTGGITNPLSSSSSSSSSFISPGVPGGVLPQGLFSHPLWNRLPLFAWLQYYQPFLITIIHYMIGITLVWKFLRFTKRVLVRVYRWIRQRCPWWSYYCCFCCCCCCRRCRPAQPASSISSSDIDADSSTDDNDANSDSSSSTFDPLTLSESGNGSGASLMLSPSSISSLAYGAVLPIVTPTQMSPGPYYIRLSSCSQKRMTFLQKHPAMYYLSYDAQSLELRLMDVHTNWSLNRRGELKPNNDSSVLVSADSGCGSIVPSFATGEYTDDQLSSEYALTTSSNFTLNTNGTIQWGDKVLGWIPTGPPSPLLHTMIWQRRGVLNNFTVLTFSFHALQS